MIVRLSVGSSQTRSIAADSSGENASREPRRDGQDVLAAPLALEARHSRTMEAVINVSTHPNIFNLPFRLREPLRRTREVDTGRARGRDGSPRGRCPSAALQVLRPAAGGSRVSSALPAIGRAGDAPPPVMSAVAMPTGATLHG